MMNYHIGSCTYDCTICSTVCPSGAILPIGSEEKKLAQIGKSKFVREDCIVITKKADCGACHPGYSAITVNLALHVNGTVDSTGGTCTTCHGTHTIASEQTHNVQLEQTCLTCHPAIEDQFKQSVHAEFNEGRNKSHCFECHGEHRSRAPSDTTLRVANESPAEATCGACHQDQLSQWTGTPMSLAGQNRWMYDIYNGTGTPGGMGGFVYTRDSHYRASDPASECASCHQPGAERSSIPLYAIFYPAPSSSNDSPGHSAWPGEKTWTAHRLNVLFRIILYP